MYKHRLFLYNKCRKILNKPAVMLKNNVFHRLIVQYIVIL